MMELVMEIRNARRPLPGGVSSKTFKRSGGVIGRALDCEWAIPDSHKHLSNRHALISYQDGAFFLMDISKNGTRDCASGQYLRPGEAVRIENGSAYLLGGFELRARLVRDPELLDRPVGLAQAAGSSIPDDAFMAMDPLIALDQQEDVCPDVGDLLLPVPREAKAGQHADYARIDTESLVVPELVAPPARPAAVAQAPVQARLGERFWERFADALGTDLQGLDDDGREALALSAARLLRLSVDGLQQSLRTRSELKNELRLAQTTVQGAHKNPLKFAADAAQALDMLLQPARDGRLNAEQAVAAAFRDLQAHQVALLAASRAAVRGTLEHFAPRQLILRFERDDKPWFATAASRWKAYGRYHQALCQDDDWSERLLARDFAQAYEEQVRLISTLHTDPQG